MTEARAEGERELGWPAERLFGALPHRPPAVWIDRVIRASAEGGECEILLRPEGRYFSGSGEVREFAWLEWMAQAYGYASAAHAAAQAEEAGQPPPAAPARAFLVGVRGLVFPGGSPDSRARAGEILRIRVRRTHQMGPLSLVDGEVRDASGETLARASLKLFAE